MMLKTLRKGEKVKPKMVTYKATEHLGYYGKVERYCYFSCITLRGAKNKASRWSILSGSTIKLWDVSRYFDKKSVDIESEALEAFKAGNKEWQDTKCASS
jgi:hypothetical protein